MGIIKEMQSAIWNEERLLNELVDIDENLEYTEDEREAKRTEWCMALMESVTSIGATAGLMKGLEYKAKRFREEADAAKRRAETAENIMEYVGGKIRDYMVANSIERIPAGVFEYSLRKSSPLDIDDIRAIPPEYIKREVIETPMKNEIKAALKKGIEVPGAHIGERKNLQLK